MNQDQCERCRCRVDPDELRRFNAREVEHDYDQPPDGCGYDAVCERCREQLSRDYPASRYYVEGGFDED